MNMDVEMGNLLKGCFAYRVPQAKPLVRKRRPYRTGNMHERGHQGSAGNMIEFSHVTHVSPRYHEGMARVKLPEINECHREVILIDDAGRQSAIDNVTK